MKVSSAVKKLATIKAILKRIKRHNVAVSSAGVAFYGLLALVPTLIALISVYALVADPAEIEQQVTDAAGSLDEDTKNFVTAQLKSIVGEVESTSEEPAEKSGQLGRWIALATGLLLALFSASGAVAKLMGTISTAYEVEEDRPGWKVRALAYLFTASAIVGIALLVFLIGLMPIILDQAGIGKPAQVIFGIFQPVFIILLFGGALTMFYRYSPDRDMKTPYRNQGAIVATLLFLLFSFGFSYYSSNVGAMPASYGLLGSIAAIMIFLQLTALAVIVGAEVNGYIERPTGGPTRRIDDKQTDPTLPPVEPIGFGKALAGLVALFVLGKSEKD